MRIAVVSDIHGNLTAFEAVLADLRETAPDLVLHGGDLADSGSSPVEIIDRIRDLGWAGVAGNTDELLFRPRPVPNFPIVEEQARWTRSMLGTERVHWLSTLPLVYLHEEMALVHAGPTDAWRAPTPDATDVELESIYGVLGRPLTVYGHIHRPFIRRAVANTGSVSLSHDGDPRASYLLVDLVGGAKPEIRRVAYDLDRERELLRGCRLPRANWIASMMAAARFQMP